MARDREKSELFHQHSQRNESLPLGLSMRNEPTIKEVRRNGVPSTMGTSKRE